MAIAIKESVEKLNVFDGPNLEQYLETRFNLATKVLEALEVTLRERIDCVEHASIERKKALESNIAHLAQVSTIIQECAAEATKVARDTQAAHNVAANEWRKTVQDFKDGTVTRAEFNRLDTAFSAYKLEIAQTVSARQIHADAMGEGSREQKTDSRAGIATVISIALGAATIASILVGIVLRMPHL